MSATSSTAERRRHPRVSTSLTLHCQRLGRDGVDAVVEVVDLSMAGVRITAPRELQVGDVVGLTIEGPDRLTLSGLVVHLSGGDTGREYGHIAFTRLVPASRDQIGQLIDLTVGS